ERVRDNRFEKIPIIADLLFDLSSILERPLMSVRVKLNIEAGVGEVAKFICVQKSEQVLLLDRSKRDVKSVCHFFQEFQTILGHQRRSEFLRHRIGLGSLGLKLERTETA